jgi:3-dehydroquinate dehydratase/shikimate dehydrogenase
MQASADRICVVVGRTRHKMMAIEVHEAARRGAKLIELRLDFLARAVDFKRLLANRPCELCATVRRHADGGRWNGAEGPRQMLLRQAIAAGFDWVDLETDIADEIKRFGKVKRIVSYHNLTETPADLEDIYARMVKQDADVLKLAVTAQTPADNLRMLKLLQTAPRPTVGHCMGEIGFPSRVLALKFNPPFVYAAFNRERGIAPGLPSFDELVNVYGIDRVGPDTQVFGVVGDPVSHSYSPMLHNAVYRRLGVNAIYLPFRVPRGELPGFLAAYDAVPVQGYSVTIPHKEAAAAAAADTEGAVGRTGSANTLVRRPEGGFVAHNTDYVAILESIQANLPLNEAGQPLDLRGKRGLVLGAGGVSRSVAFALRELGVQVVVTGRTSERAESLAREVEGKWVPWDARHSVECEVVVNGTPVGMHPEVDETPLHHSALRPGLVVFDTIYNPETTLLVKEARARGCTVITGVDLFVRQAGWQVRLFTGQEPPFDFMRAALKRAMSPVNLPEPEEGEAGAPQPA